VSAISPPKLLLSA